MDLAVVKLGTLRARGWSAHEARTVLAAHGYEALGRGWFARPDADRRLTSALRVGCRLTCASAGRLRGLWVPPHTGTHVCALRTGAAPVGMVGHVPVLRTWPDDEPLVPCWTALQHAARCLGVCGGAVLIESALNLGLLRQHQVEELVSGLPTRLRHPLLRVRHGSQSGTETVVRMWLLSRNVSVRAQVQIDGVGRVDLLVGESWVIELDSEQHHAAVRGYHEDRRRDLQLRRLGYTVTRLTYQQVFHQWPQTRAALTEILRRRRHRRRI